MIYLDCFTSFAMTMLTNIKRLLATIRNVRLRVYFKDSKYCFKISALLHSEVITSKIFGLEAGLK